jgi:hypothetical protein
MPLGRHGHSPIFTFDSHDPAYTLRGSWLPGAHEGIVISVTLQVTNEMEAKVEGPIPFRSATLQLWRLMDQGSLRELPLFVGKAACRCLTLHSPAVARAPPRALMSAPDLEVAAAKAVGVAGSGFARSKRCAVRGRHASLARANADSGGSWCLASSRMLFAANVLNLGAGLGPGRISCGSWCPYRYGSPCCRSARSRRAGRSS